MILEMSRPEYDKLAAVNWSSLKHMAKSPAHYQHYIRSGRKDTAALKRGRAVHLAVLEPERFAVECVKWDGGTRRGRAWDSFEASHVGREILTEDEWEQAQAIAEAVRGDPIASRYVSGGVSERSLRFTVRGSLQCKARVDFVSDAGCLVDLKTAKDASPGAFGRAVVNYMLHGQAAWYADGLSLAAQKEPPPFRFVVAEPEPPYAVGVYQVPDDILDLGRELYAGLLDRLEDCRARFGHEADPKAKWPSYSAEEQLLVLPRWAMPREDEDDVSGLDLSFNAGE